MNSSDKAEVYRGRKPRESPLWQLFDHHFDEFDYRYDDLFSREYGFFRPVISHIVRKYLECGDLEQGFARVRCPDCHHEYLLAFSCRGRWFCPSCHGKKVVQFGSHYRSKMSHGGNKRNFEMFSPLDFIAAITQHIPERLAQMMRYYGWYSNRMRGDRQRAELLQGESEKTEEQTSEVIVISNFRTKKIPPLVWRECIKKVWEVDPLLCSHCGGLMKIVSFIYEHRVIKKILAHLDLLRGEEQKRGPPAPLKKCSEVVVKPFDDGWPEY
jgi:hypothetical protein